MLKCTNVVIVTIKQLSSQNQMGTFQTKAEVKVREEL
jgi:hypothetical protein